MTRKRELTARIEPFDSFWEAPDDIERGYSTFYRFYRNNYLKYLPGNTDAKILVISCGPGYFMNLLKKHGYTNILGIDSTATQVKLAREHGHNCEVAEAFPYLEAQVEEYDLIFCEQELNHLTKEEIMEFMDLCMNSMKPGGILVTHALNGANPVTGAEALAQNFDHYNTFTEYTFRQILEFKGYEGIEIFPLNLYVFYNNPLNYILILVSKLYNLFFTASFIMYGKKNRLWTKKIGAVCKKAG